MNPRRLACLAPERLRWHVGPKVVALEDPRAPAALPLGEGEAALELALGGDPWPFLVPAVAAHVHVLRRDAAGRWGALVAHRAPRLAERDVDEVLDRLRASVIRLDAAARFLGVAPARWVAYVVAPAGLPDPSRATDLAARRRRGLADLRRGVLPGALHDTVRLTVTARDL